MKFISVGDLVLDIYYDDKLNYIGSDGGISAFNILCNLAYFGFNTKAYGICGNDIEGKLAIKSLSDCNVKTDITINKNIKTKAYQIRRIKENNRMCYRSIKYCPFCNKSNWYDNSFIDENKIIKKIKKEDIIIFDNLNNKNQYIIDNTMNIKLLDLGQYNEFEYINLKEIVCKIKNKFTIINLNQRVEKYLLEKFNIEDSITLAKMMKVKLLIITRGDKGCDFIYRNKLYSFPITNVIEEVDDSGAGDIFFSTIIKNWANNNFKFSSKLLNKWFLEASLYSGRIIKLIGSRSLIKKLYSEKYKMNCGCELK